VSGYRAPSFSITDWATEILAELGIEYDSSRFRASAHDRYGSLSTEADSTVTRLASGIREVQLPVVDIPGIQIPCAGGAYFRLLPYPLFRRIVSRSREAFVFYLHPWEIDPDQPRITDVPLSYRLRHYTNLERTEGRLDRLLADFDWSPIESLL
jgi:polysaccharide deacetylase family protein (PEP-CTERM system associated)